MTENQVKDKEKKQDEKKDEKKDEKEKKKPEFKISVTHHTVNIDGKPVSYTARAGILEMKDDKDKYNSHIFFVSYEKNVSETEKIKRPITFAFNGGPGAPAVWLHMGALGPKRVYMTDDGDFTPPPFRLEENPYTWLDFTDLVFIDPVGTGYSGHPEDEDPKKFYGVMEDIESVGEFIRLYTTRFNRWLSPKFISGESYGTTRASGLSAHLQCNLGMDISGIILVSSVLDFGTIRFVTGNDLMPYALFVPSYTATAWYHKKLNDRLMQDLEATLKEVETWVLNEYMTALVKGNSLSDEEFDNIAEKLSEYTGLSKKYVVMSKLRITNARFMKELLREEGITLGRLDTRFKGSDSDSAGEYPEYDPSFVAGLFIATVNDYIRRELKYENDNPYQIINPVLGQTWNWKTFEYMGFPNVQDLLKHAIHTNKYLRVLVTSGYFDVGTPYFAMKYSVDHLKLAPEMRNNIEMTNYIAGHMVYYPKDMLIKFTKDVKDFYDRTLNQSLKP
jgi:carboxypeptidase C (cathepsin A)